MATLADAQRLVETDPPIGFVSLPIIALEANRKAALTVKLKGQTLLLPGDWGLAEWLWYLRLAITISERQSTVGNTAQVTAKQRAKLAVDMAIASAPGLFSAAVTPEGAFVCYDAAVRLVIASNAAAAGDSRGRQAWEAFKAGLAEAPQTVVGAVGSVLQHAGDLFFKQMPSAAARTLADLFGSAASGLFSGLGTTGTIIVVGLGLWAANKYLK